MSRHGFLKGGFATGRFQAELADEEAEDDKIQGGPDRPQDEEPERIGRLWKEDDVIDESVGKGETVLDPQQDAQRVGNTSQKRVDGIEHGCDKEKRELDRFGNTGQERRQ